MQYLEIDGINDSLAGHVQRYGRDYVSDCADESAKLRGMLARLLDVLAERELLSDEELKEIIRGY